MLKIPLMLLDGTKRNKVQLPTPSLKYLNYKTDCSSRKQELTSKAARGFILGPNVWNIFYDEL